MNTQIYSYFKYLLILGGLISLTTVEAGNQQVLPKHGVSYPFASLSNQINDQISSAALQSSIACPLVQIPDPVQQKTS